MVPEPILAFWCRVPSRPNFGDALTPWLIRKITGRPPRFVVPEDPRTKYLVTGSIMRWAGAASIVWGAGVLDRDDPVSPRARILAVRGPLTRARALECGADCPETFGDPALLLPRFHAPPPGQRAGVGIVPHFSDWPRLVRRRLPAGVHLIDVQAPVERVIDAVASCELVASSSLHGLIVAHAYGVPAAWLKFRDLPSGDDSKFRDYFLSIGREPPQPLWTDFDQVAPELVVRAAVLPRGVDTGPLWRACPFRRAS
jgi:pyruvyltransferase